MSKISLFQSIPLGIGSIIGSGILFLPSLTYKVSGPDVLLSWILIVVLCLPGILFFKDMVRLLHHEDTSLSGMVSLGLGKDVGRSVHLILLGTVIIGMPSAAIVAGSYCEEVFGIAGVKIFVSLSLITVALAVNSFGLKASSLVSFIIAGLLVIVSVYLIFETSQPVASYKVLKPTLNFSNIYSGAVLSFWAFAGFENLTFLYHRFKNPQRDLIITIFISVISCAVLYIGLVANYASIVPYFEIKQTIGLIQMASYAGGNMMSFIIAAFALLAVAVNLISWTSGVKELIGMAGKTGVMPIIAKEKPLLLLGGLFYCSLFFGLVSPEIFEKLLSLVSTNFLVLYLLTILSFAIVTESILKRVVAALIAVSITVTLSSSSFFLLYPFCLFLVSYLRSRSHVNA